MRVALCAVAEIPGDGAIKVSLFGREVLVYLVDGQPRAIANVCMHLGGPLAQWGDQFVCAWHGATYRCQDGRRLGGPGAHGARLMTIPTQAEGATLFYVWDAGAQGSRE